MSDSLPFALEARCVSELYLTTAWTLYAQKMRSKAEAHSAHLKALEACEAFEQQELLVRNGILNPVRHQVSESPLCCDQANSPADGAMGKKPFDPDRSISSMDGHFPRSS